MRLKALVRAAWSAGETVVHFGPTAKRAMVGRSKVRAITGSSSR